MDQDSSNSEPRRPKIMGDGADTIMPMSEADLPAMLAQMKVAEAISPAAPQPLGRAEAGPVPGAPVPAPMAAGELSAPAGELSAAAAPGPAAPPAATGLSGPMPTAAPSSVGLEDWIPDTPLGATFVGPVDGNDELAYYRQPDGSIIERPTFWPDQMRLSALHIAAKLGIPIFPCRETGYKEERKTPRTKNGHNDATADPIKVGYWWQTWKQAPIGMPTGPASGVFIVDIDVKDGVDGFAALAELEKQHGPLPRTKQVHTPSGGQHFYFNMPEGIKIPTRAGKIAPGIDVRGDGGYVILPPSRLFDEAGKKLGAYEWEDPNEAVAECPEWLLALATAKAGRKKTGGSRRVFAGATWQDRTLDQHCRSVTEAQKGSRNDELNRAAFALGQMLTMKGFERGEVEDRLFDAAKACGLLSETNGERHVRATIQSGLEAGLAKPREVPIYPDRLKSGVPDGKSLDNIRSLLAWLGVELSGDRFADKARISGLKEYGFLDDNVLAEVWGKAQDTGFRVAKNQLSDALTFISLEQEFHPVRDYFNGLEWDGVPRLDRLLTQYFGAEDADYTSAIGAKTLIAAARRIRRPGAKFDQMIVLEGPQGSGKSTALKILAIKDDWFTDGVSLTDDSKVFIEQTEGKLIVEVPELKGMRRAEMEHVKATLSRTSDRARKAYGRYASEVQRQFILVASTNDASYLKDDTGNRRFWPVKTSEIDLEALRQDRDQIWAEAVYREAQGESIELPRELWGEAEVQQQARMSVDPWLEAIDDALGEMEGKIFVEEVWAIIGKRPAQRTQFDKERLGRTMQGLRWERKLLRTKDRDSGRAYFYVKGEQPYPEILIAQQPGMPLRAFYPPDQPAERAAALKVV